MDYDNFDTFRNAGVDVDPGNKARDIRNGAARREEAVYTAVVDIIEFGIGRGYTDAQVRGALNDLFNTYAAEWSVYVFIGADGIVTALQNDATIPWLNLDASGQTIRQRLINRLT